MRIFANENFTTPVMNKEILKLAIPSILANITIPLVGLVDVAIIGHISDATAIGGIAIGTLLFDLLYWNFGFLRVGTSGLTAQAFGAKDDRLAVGIFRQNLLLAGFSTLLVWAIQWLFLMVALKCIPCTPEVADFASHYFYIRSWAAPATLGLMVFKGWFIGMQNTVAPMVCDIVVNVVNMVASYVLALHTSLGMLGVAHGTVIAQYVGLLTAVAFLLLRYGKMMRAHFFEPKIFNKIEKVVRLAGNLFVRSVGFMVIYVGFTALASKYGDVQLAVSSIMMKLFMLFSYFVDGFAYAGEALTGRFIGERNEERLHAAMRILFLWCISVGLAFTLFFAIAGDDSVRIVTSDAAVVEASHPFLPWLIAMPLISCLAFMWDGIYIGAAAGKEVRNCMLWAAMGFVLGYLCCYKAIGIQALYVGYFVHLLVRTVYLFFLWKKTKAKAFSIA